MEVYPSMHDDQNNHGPTKIKPSHQFNAKPQNMVETKKEKNIKKDPGSSKEHAEQKYKVKKRERDSKKIKDHSLLPKGGICKQL
jgi:hypothetical protein